MAGFLVHTLFELTYDIRQKRHVASAFNGLCESTLVSGRETGAAARQNFAVRIDEFAQRLNIFVVDALELDVIIFWHTNKIYY